MLYSGCQKNVPIAERFFATTLMPPSFFRNIIMTSGIAAGRSLLAPGFEPVNSGQQASCQKPVASSQVLKDLNPRLESRYLIPGGFFIAVLSVYFLLKICNAK
jgi:hypothetical protein